MKKVFLTLFAAFMLCTAVTTVLADGSDPMPLCRHKKCWPFLTQK